MFEYRRVSNQTNGHLYIYIDIGDFDVGTYLVLIRGSGMLKEHWNIWFKDVQDLTHQRDTEFHQNAFFRLYQSDKTEPSVDLFQQQQQQQQQEQQ